MRRIRRARAESGGIEPPHGRVPRAAARFAPHLAQSAAAEGHPQHERAIAAVVWRQPRDRRGRHGAVSWRRLRRTRSLRQRNAREKLPAPFGRAEHPRAAQLEKRPSPRPARDRHRPRRAERGQRISTIKARHPDRGPADRSPLRQARKGAAEEGDVGPRRAAVL